MGNHRFRFSDMLPNAWFYKLKDMGRPGRNPGIPHTLKKNHTPRMSSSATKPLSQLQPPPKQPYHPGRASYYFPSGDERLPNSPIHPRASDTLFPVDSPRKSNKKARRRLLRSSTRLVTSSVSSGCSCQASPGSVVTSETTPEFSVSSESSPGENGFCDVLLCSEKPTAAENFEFRGNGSLSRTCRRKVTSSPTDIIIDMGSKSSFTRSLDKSEKLDSVSELDLPPILTKPTEKETETSKLEHRNVKSGEKSYRKLDPGTPLKGHKSPPRRSFNSIQGIKVRANSPRLASKKIQACRNRKTVGSMPRRALTESFAVMKSSADPQRDFRESMVEMILENNIRASKDLEELLACYLSLNSSEYHDLIVKVFEQIWFDLTDIRL